MDLAEFVEETLSEVLKGIRAAQGKEGGGAVGAAGISAWSPNHPSTTLLLPGFGDTVFIAVEFDVSVTSRVRFAVQLKIPRGDEAERAPGF